MTEIKESTDLDASEANQRAQNYQKNKVFLFSNFFETFKVKFYIRDVKSN
jgi:hypothetical protein